jgi:hypothetical protein
MRGGIDDGVEPVAVGLVAVERVVLERRDDALALDAVDGLGAEDGAEPGIFGVVLEVPAVAHVAGEVDAAGQHDVEAAHPRLAADRCASVAREPGIEARADDDGRGECRGALVVRPIARVGDAHAGVAALQRRDAEPRDSGCIARAHVDAFGDALVAREANRGNGAHETDDEREPLVVGHLLLDLARSQIGGRLGRDSSHLATSGSGRGLCTIHPPGLRQSSDAAGPRSTLSGSLRRSVIERTSQSSTVVAGEARNRQRVNQRASGASRAPCPARGPPGVHRS